MLDVWFPALYEDHHINWLHVYIASTKGTSISGLVEFNTCTWLDVAKSLSGWLGPNTLKHKQFTKGKIIVSFDTGYNIILLLCKSDNIVV